MALASSSWHGHPVIAPDPPQANPGVRDQSYRTPRGSSRLSVHLGCAWRFLFVDGFSFITMPLLAAFLSALLSASKDFLSKSVSSKVSSRVSTFASFSYALPFYLVAWLIALSFGWETVVITTTFLSLAFLRSVADIFAEWSRMHAFKSADVSVVSSLLALSPVILLFISPALTNDRITYAGMLGVVLVAVGSLLMVYRPGVKHSAQEIRGVAFAVAGSFFFAINSCLDRLAVQQAGPITSGFAMTLFSALLLLPLLPFKTARSEFKTGAKEFWLRGFLEITFMVSKLYAMQTLPAAYVVAILRSSMLFSVIGGRIIFKEQGFRRKLIATSLMLCGVVVIVLEV